MMFVNILLWFGLAYLGLVFSYLLAITLASWCYRSRGGNPHSLSFGVVIPAHNEGRHIQATIRSIQNAENKDATLEIFVIADNCTDDTASRAAECGAVVLNRDEPDRRGKGHALDWFLQAHADRYAHHDALCFLDADVQLDPSFFTEMGKALADETCQVVQGFNGVANPFDSWRTALTTAAFNTFNHLRCAGSFRLLGSTLLKGNGMVFRTAVLKGRGWPAHGLAEDLEFSLLLAEAGIAIHYQSTAIVTSEMTISRKQADAQRNRWEGARMALSVKNLGRSIGTGKPHLVGDLMTPPLSLLILLTVIFLTGSRLCAHPGLLLSIPAFFVFGAYVGSAQLQRKAPLRLYGALFFFPFFLIWKASLYVRWMTQGRGQSWSRTVRNASL